MSIVRLASQQWGDGLLSALLPETMGFFLVNKILATTSKATIYKPHRVYSPQSPFLNGLVAVLTEQEWDLGSCLSSPSCVCELCIIIIYIHNNIAMSNTKEMNYNSSELFMEEKETFWSCLWPD